MSDIGETQLKFAFEHALRHLGEFLPSIQQLRSYAEQWRPADPITDSRRILDRGDKPPGWEPLKPGELEELRGQVKKAALESNMMPEGMR